MTATLAKERRYKSPSFVGDPQSTTFCNQEASMRRPILLYLAFPAVLLSVTLKQLTAAQDTSGVGRGTLAY